MGPVVPACSPCSHEAEAGGSLERRSSRPALDTMRPCLKKERKEGRDGQRDRREKNPGR